MRTLAVAVAVITIFACDPGFYKPFPVDSSAATTPLEQVLREFERDHLGTQFFRVEVPDDIANDYRDRGYRILRWYDRDRELTSQRGSHVYLAVVARTEDSRIDSSLKISVTMAFV
jgi:hypothetical protein